MKPQSSFPQRDHRALRDRLLARHTTDELSSDSNVSLRSDANQLLKVKSVASMALAGVALFGGEQLAAQTSTAEVLPEVVVTAESLGYQTRELKTTKYSEPLLNVPQTVNVIPQELIQDQGAVSLRDVLRNVPGITMQAGEGSGGLQGDSLNIRGFNSRGDIFVDGSRDYGTYHRDPFNYERLEVYKGPASANTGRGSAGGSLNMVTKTPKLNPFYQLEGTTSVIGADPLYRTTLDINQPFWLKRSEASNPSASSSGKESKAVQTLGETIVESGSAFRLNLLFHEQDVPGRNFVEQKRWAVAPSIAFGLGTDTQLTFTYLHQEERNVPDYGQPFVLWNATHPELRGHLGGRAPVNIQNWYGLDGYDFEDIETDMVGMLFEHRFSEHLKVRNFTRYTRNEVESRIVSPRFAGGNPSPDLINRDYKYREQEYESWSNALDFIIDFETGPLTHSVLAGFEYVHEEQTRQSITGSFAGSTSANRAFPATNLHHPSASDSYSVSHSVGVPSIAKVDTVGLYLFDTIKLGEKFQLNGGFRYDHVDTDIDGFTRNDEMVSWRAALVYKPVEYGSVYFGYGTSFSPSGDSVEGLGFTTRDENNNSINVIDLDPEEIRSYELGTKWDLFDGRLSLSGALFRVEKTNARTVDTISAEVSLEGEQVIQGVELGFAGSITDWWRVFGGYVYSDSEITGSRNAADTGKRLGNTPLNTFTLWTVFDLPGRVQVGAGAQYVGDRDNNVNTQFQMGDYLLFDAMVSYQATENLSFRLNVHNLTDEEYIDKAAGNHYIPGAGRSVTLTASLKF